ncbi:MAG: hypothetical protein ACOCG5_08895 [Candidatus Alkaliphilus sp. MAG34]
MLAWKELGKAFGETHNDDERLLVFEKLDLFGEGKFKKDVFFKLANEVSGKDNSNLHLSQAKRLFDGKDKDPEEAKYYFTWGMDKKDVENEKQY